MSFRSMKEKGQQIIELINNFIFGDESKSSGIISGQIITTQRLGERKCNGKADIKHVVVHYFTTSLSEDNNLYFFVNQ